MSFFVPFPKNKIPNKSQLALVCLYDTGSGAWRPATPDDFPAGEGGGGGGWDGAGYSATDPYLSGRFSLYSQNGDGIGIPPVGLVIDNDNLSNPYPNGDLKRVAVDPYGRLIVAIGSGSAGGGNGGLSAEYVTSSGYNASGTDGASANLSVDKINGGLLVNQGRLDKNEDTITVYAKNSNILLTADSITGNYTGSSLDISLYNRHAYQFISNIPTGSGCLFKIEASLNNSNWISIYEYNCVNSLGHLYQDEFIYPYTRVVISNYQSGTFSVLETHKSI